MNKMKTAAIAAALLVSAALAAPAMAQAPAQAPSPADMQRAKAFMQKSMGMMTPELQEKVKALPPEIQQFLMRIAVRHPRYSETLTLRQVMEEILADYQSVANAIATDNGELAADAARRIANHRLPKGGLLPYLPLEKINAKDLGVLPAMEAAVEGGATKLAEAADKGDMAAAARHFGDVTSGCVACHAHFRGQPGVSARLK